MINFTSETPYNFEGGMLPILNVKVRIKKNEGNRLDFELLKNPQVILADLGLNLGGVIQLSFLTCFMSIKGMFM